MRDNGVDAVVAPIKDRNMPFVFIEQVAVQNATAIIGQTGVCAFDDAERFGRVKEQEVNPAQIIKGQHGPILRPGAIGKGQLNRIDLGDLMAAGGQIIIVQLKDLGGQFFGGFDMG